MARLQPLPPIPGVKDLLTLLRFLGDTDSYSKRLVDMETLGNEIDERVKELLGAEDLVQAKSKFNEDLASFNRRRSEWISEVETVRAGLKTRENSVAQAEELVKRRDSELDLRERDLGRDRAQMEELCKAREDAARKTVAEADKAKAEMLRLKEEYQEKLEQLKNFTEKLS